ncbi:methylated-DNA--[protein]-cysteine S-methyltransferase [Cellulosilyticum sp. I15G10I2]|uniref:methylated-DNA--[protein]-cysteine S-methyltransferase n=1 Tax=Cellulosilyticum sp. I15G10I2 TaxID=1892843 RepID=UPI00085C368C|nr:methylated-DNA--[protein]-cysteine S-methyltransferase [Cellulosilyticum sp. I15G10I2]
MKIGYDIYESSLIGPIGMIVSDRGLERIMLFEEEIDRYLKENTFCKRNEGLCKEIKQQIDEYFKGERTCFNFAMHIEGTPFREQVWQNLARIPYGTTISYSELASRIGNPKAVRAVGGANRANPIPLIIPCHRVIGKNGEMVGFAGSKVDTKIKLLEHEHRYLA